MITIDQLLESVDLDFEPRWVTKDEDGRITIWKHSPKVAISAWIPQHPAFDDRLCIGKLKLAEFENKPWQECIYEVPRKTTGKIEKLEMQEISHGGENMVLHIQKVPATAEEMHEKINELVEAVNELKARMELPRLNPDLTEEDLRKMMRDPKYWRDNDSATIQKVQNGFNKLYGDKN